MRSANNIKYTKQLFINSCFVILLIAATAFSFFIFVATLYKSLHPPLQKEIPASSEPTTTTVASGILPKKLIIPSLDIDTKVENVGITGNGNIGTPSSFNTVAWYKYGPKPGDPGKAILDGHVDNGLGLSGIFLHLSSIKIGADIYLTDAKGSKLHFVVVATSTADYTARLDSVTEKTPSKSGLLLITCEGNWVSKSRTYDKRVLILADLI